MWGGRDLVCWSVLWSTLEAPQSQSQVSDLEAIPLLTPPKWVRWSISVTAMGYLWAPPSGAHENSQASRLFHCPGEEVDHRLTSRQGKKTGSLWNETEWDFLGAWHDPGFLAPFLLEKKPPLKSAETPGVCLQAGKSPSSEKLEAKRGSLDVSRD